ncbi:DUF4255 domain-containing protein [Lewinella cohaerens]|uniref:DUF4255 domain-containing protein n=1 Tax=Lewinella cohaerens TaxID=70995 RepID=UPI00037C4F09|nr:DUF4255 domain-containing protein [Lewinella cohaerens]
MPIVRDTIADTLSILRLTLENGLDDIETNTDDAVELNNIAFWDMASTDPRAVSNSIIVTLVKTEEEFAMKNRPAHRRNPVTGSLEYVNPPVFLNLHVLFTVNTPNYDTALTYLSRIIGFFQHQRVFTENNSSVPNDVNIDTFHFNVSMLSPSLEQLNHLWGILGGRMLPSVLYRFQIQRIEYIDQPEPAPQIETIIVNEQLY